MQYNFYTAGISGQVQFVNFLTYIFLLLKHFHQKLVTSVLIVFVVVQQQNII